MTVRPEELVQLRDKLVADGECFNVHEANMKHPNRVRMWKSAGVHRPWHAGRDTLKNPGGPKGSERRSSSYSRRRT